MGMGMYAYGYIKKKNHVLNTITSIYMKILFSIIGKLLYFFCVK